jgi:hypothetical protein
MEAVGGPWTTHERNLDRACTSPDDGRTFGGKMNGAMRAVEHFAQRLRQLEPDHRIR